MAADKLKVGTGRRVNAAAGVADQRGPTSAATSQMFQITFLPEQTRSLCSTFVLQKRDRELVF